MKLLKHLVAPIIGAILLTSCANAPDAAKSNIPMSVCIVSGEDATDGPTADYMGHTVNFCCDRCASKWTKMSNDKKQAAWDKLSK